MQKIYIVIFLISLNYCFGQEKTQLKTIDDFLEIEYTKNKPGAVVLIAKNGNILFKNSYGLASLKPKRKLKTNMVFQVASISKQFVSAAILKLVEEGKISLTDTIQKYVPYFPTKKYPITIHHLLSQTSGIPEYFILEDDELYLLAKEHTPKEIISYYKDEPLSFKPREKWEYSNSNYPLLGAALEKITGISLQKYLKIHFFDPLKMNSTAIGYRKTTKKKSIPVGYDHKDGKLFPGPKIIGSAMYAAGRIVSTVDDLFLWSQELKNKTIISEFIFNQLTTEKTIASGEKTGYGYGLFLNNIQGSKTIQHDGNLYGYTSTMLYLPKEDVFVCVLTNSKYDRTQEIANYIASLMIDKPLTIQNSKEISSKQLQEYLGVYKMKTPEISRTFEIKLLDNAILLIDPDAPESSALLTPSEKDVLLLKVANATFHFKRDTKGIIIGYEVKQGKDKYQFDKI